MNPTIKNHSENVKGYKAVKKDGKGFYTDGLGSGKKTYFKKGAIVKVEGEPVLCKNGIHFFRNIGIAVDYLEKNNAIFEVESLGNVQEDTGKSVTNKIKIGNKITLKQLKGIFDDPKKLNSGNYNSGDKNSGDNNSGYKNSGYKNSGYKNSGNYNSGDKNSGYKNSGYKNSGYKNSGNYNSGDNNSGYKNSGNNNSGDYNSGNYNSGDGYRDFFCTKTKYFLFDVEVKKETIDKFNNIDMYSWFELNESSIDGYKKAWEKCPENVLDELKKIPQFKLKKNKAKFKEITGINL